MRAAAIRIKCIEGNSSVKRSLAAGPGQLGLARANSASFGGGFVLLHHAGWYSSPLADVPCCLAHVRISLLC